MLMSWNHPQPELKALHLRYSLAKAPKHQDSIYFTNILPHTNSKSNKWNMGITNAPAGKLNKVC